MQERTIASKFPSAASAAKGNAASTPALPAALRNARRSNRPANRSPQHEHAGSCTSDIVALLDGSFPGVDPAHSASRRRVAARHSSAANPKFATGLAAVLCELPVRGTGAAWVRDEPGLLFAVMLELI